MATPPSCIIEFERGNKLSVTGTLEDVHTALTKGGLVRFVDPWGRDVMVNGSTVTNIRPTPNGDR